MIGIGVPLAVPVLAPPLLDELVAAWVDALVAAAALDAPEPAELLLDEPQAASAIVPATTLNTASRARRYLDPPPLAVDTPLLIGTSSSFSSARPSVKPASPLPLISGN
jgi:hypothetical protein